MHIRASIFPPSPITFTPASHRNHYLNLAVVTAFVVHPDLEGVYRTPALLSEPPLQLCTENVLQKF